MNPLGENFEGLVTFKHHCDKKDPFYVYKVNDTRGNPDSPSFVFKTSKIKLSMAENMNKDGNHFLSKEYCFLMENRNAAEITPHLQQVFITRF